ncbi:hypothetical protein FKM82_007626 [Ascaphus truei]|uniref:protein LKAAEAR1 n=1 Tax=Ascaphus truei TaxID=8439 RepID=UPI003F592ECF
MAAGGSSKKERFVPKNWKTVAQGDVRKMAPLQRARYLAYEQPNKTMVASLLVTQNRLKEQALQTLQEPPQRMGDPGQEKENVVVGQLKAAEARNRIRLMRFRFQCMRAQEINHLISCQPTARDAIRLEVLLPPMPDTVDLPDSLDRFQREHIEDLLKDERGLLTNRIP